jgi:ketosteroid isomerase-like protein
VKLKVLAAFMSVVSILVVPGAMSAQAGDEARTEAAAMVAEAVRMDQMFLDLYNDRKFEELGARYYAEDAIALPPNHEPIQGRAAIAEYFRGVRDSLGEAEFSGPPLGSSVSGDLVSIIPQYSAHQGQLRVVAHELFERQPDGSLLCVHDAFGFRDPLRQ